MAQHFYLDGVELDPERVRLESDRPLAQTAEITDVAGAGVQIEDPDGDLAFNGWKTFTVTEDDCTETVTWLGYIGPRRVSRGDRYWQGAARIWACDLYDINAIIGLRVLRTATAKRPYETETARMTWLLGSEAVSGLVFDNGYIVTNDQAFDEADFRGQYAINVIGSMGSTAKQGYVFWDSGAASGEEVTLWYDVPTSTSRVSTLRITNVLSEVDDSVTFAVTEGEEMTRDPSPTFSGVYMTWRGGTLYQELADTATSFIARDGLYDSQRIGRAATAAAAATNWLVASSVEQDRIACTVRLPSSKVNLILAGQLIDVHFSHLPGYEDDFVTTRVARRTVRPTARWDAYDLDLELNILKPLGDVGGGGGGGFPPGGGACTIGNTDLASTVTAGVVGAHETPTNPEYINDSTAGTHSDLPGHVAGAGDDHQDGWSITFASPTAVGRIRIRRYSAWFGDQQTVTALTYDYTNAYGTDISFGLGRWDVVSGFQFFESTFSFDISGEWMDIVPTAPIEMTEWVFGRIDHRDTGIGFSDGIAIQDIELYDYTCEDLPPGPGQPVNDETPTPTPDGSETDFTTSWPFADGTLRVTVDGIDQTDEVTSYDGATGDFTLSFAPLSDEELRAWYRGR